MFKKLKGEELSEELLSGCIGKIISVPINEHIMNNQITGLKDVVNVWFVGTVAGFEKQTICYNYTEDEFMDPITAYSILLTDGHAYILAKDCEMKEITEEEFDTMIKEEEAKQKARDSIILPGQVK
jgi:hypothetical protein